MTTSESNAVNPSGRVQVIPAPIASPGQCGICGTPSHPVGFADPRLDFEFYGTLIFCQTCVGDIASVFGYLPTEALVGLREQIEDQNDELNTLRQAVLGLEAAVDGLTSYNDGRDRSFSERGRSSSHFAGPIKPKVEQPTEPDAKGPDGVDPEPANPGTRPEPAVNEPPAEQRRDDVRGTSGTDSADVDELLNL